MESQRCKTKWNQALVTHEMCGWLASAGVVLWCVHLGALWQQLWCVWRLQPAAAGAERDENWGWAEEERMWSERKRRDVRWEHKQRKTEGGRKRESEQNMREEEGRGQRWQRSNMCESEVCLFRCGRGCVRRACVGICHACSWHVWAACASLHVCVVQPIIAIVYSEADGVAPLLTCWLCLRHSFRGPAPLLSSSN